MLVEPQSPVPQISEKVIKLMGGRPDKAIDCSGAEFSVQLAIEVSFVFVSDFQYTDYVREI